MITMNTPIGETPLDQTKGVLGQPLDRVDGPGKVQGHVPYAYEYQLEQKPAYGYIVQATIGKGTIEDIDTSAAEKAPGVVFVLTHKNAPPQGQGPQSSNVNPQLSSNAVRFYGQAIALVVAETFEQARAAAYLVKAQYAKQDGAFEMDPNVATAVKPKPNNGTPPDSMIGDFAGAFGAAPVTIDVTYTTPAQTHAMMEPHATIASWDGDSLTLHTANQMLPRGLECLSRTLKMPKEKIRLISRYIGGGFGAKLQVQADAVLAAIAAREIKRPVKLALTRQQVFPITTHRTGTIQRVRLGAQRDGTLTAIGHDVHSNNARGEAFYETAANATRSLYAGANRQTTHMLVPLDLAVASSMRAPGEAVGLLALECAMDELAVALNMDPIELRIKNEPKMDPEKDRAFSTRELVPCMVKGAEAFGWSKRDSVPGRTRDGQWLVGMGMAAAIRGNPMRSAKASVTLGPDGIATVKTSMTDLGTGSYTILSQITAEMLGLPMDKVRVELGDSAFPEAPGSGGSFGASSAGSAVYDACANLRDTLAKKAGIAADKATFADGAITADGKHASFASLAGADGIIANGSADPGDSRKLFNQESFGAHFAEVGVDVDTGEIRLRRMLGVFTAGRILNAKTARSQAIGGMTFGVGAALMEAIAIDGRDGSFINHNLAEYHVAVNADIPASLDAFFLPEVDPRSSAMKSKGVGELGICGAGAAVANAVYNATGVRLRDYPLTLDKMLDAWGGNTVPRRSSATPNQSAG
jgi:xanthine dehydrogenase YagR molybdenum-binding subunit